MGRRVTSKLTPSQQLQNLTDAMVEDILALSDEELRQELEEDGQDIDAIVANAKEVLETAKQAAGK